MCNFNSGKLLIGFGYVMCRAALSGRAEYLQLYSEIQLVLPFVIFRYQIGLRYTGGARMLLMLSLKFSIIPIVVPVGVRDFDIDGELWVKLRLIPTEPWVGAVSWAFVSLPKIKFELSPFRLFNLMGMSYIL